MPLKTPFLLLALLASLALAVHIYTQDSQKKRHKADLIELSQIKYGLFNVDEWKVVLADIITKKIESFDLSGENKEEMREKITNLLTVAIDDLEERYYADRAGSIGGWLQSGVASITGTFGQIKKDIPEFTELILNFLEEKENREAIRGYLTAKMDEYADNTFSATDYSQVHAILKQCEVQTVPEAKQQLADKIQTAHAKAEAAKYLLVGIAFAVVLILAFAKNMGPLDLPLTILTSAVFLVLGVTLPMIEIDARISDMTFTLLGEQISFKDQVLYYKSKSVLEVVQLMIAQGRVDLLAVGFLVLLFSVLFPLIKLVCSGAYLFVPTVREKRFVRFMVHKSGKWSMADVMVIAIFMAYIGFDGILSEQLGQLEGLAKSFELITTNQSDLLFGFFAFALFVLLSLFTSQRVQSAVSSK